MIFSFGYSTLPDLLTWIVVLTLGAKAVATLILLLVGRDARDRRGWGTMLWWTTKLTPIVAIPCAIALALMQRQTDTALLFAAMAVFVAIAVPLKVRQRRNRLAACDVR